MNVGGYSITLFTRGNTLLRIQAPVCRSVFSWEVYMYIHSDRTAVIITHFISWTFHFRNHLCMLIFHQALPLKDTLISSIISMNAGPPINKGKNSQRFSCINFTYEYKYIGRMGIVQVSPVHFIYYSDKYDSYHNIQHTSYHTHHTQPVGLICYC